jgi:hypothetical protein
LRRRQAKAIALDRARRRERSERCVSAQLFNDLGLLSYAKADYSQAEPLMRRAVAIHPNTTKVRYNLAGHEAGLVKGAASVGLIPAVSPATRSKREKGELQERAALTSVGSGL